MTCQHAPTCLNRVRDYCWPPAYIDDVITSCRSRGDDPTRLGVARGVGLQARIRERLEALGLTRPRVDLDS